MHAPLYPLLLDPAFHVKVWGGRRLATDLNKTLPTAEPYGESWEMHDTATVRNGALVGRSLGDLLEVYGTDLIGTLNDPALGFPLLAKFIDSNTWLSVQLHPNDEQAQRYENYPRGKTEAWYIMAAEPDSKLITGVKPGTTREQLRAALASDTLNDKLVYTRVQPGDVLFSPPGTVHALGPGILVYEIQQSSDITYRLHDWGRVGLDGQPRPLHIDKALSVVNLDYLPTIMPTSRDREETISVARCQFFATDLHQFMDGRIISFEDSSADRSFHALTCIEGRAVVETDEQQVVLDFGQTVLVPAGIEKFVLMGRARVLNSYQTARKVSHANYDVPPFANPT